MQSPQKKSADAAREAGSDKAAQRLAFFREQRGIGPEKPAATPPASPKTVRRKKK